MAREHWFDLGAYPELEDVDLIGDYFQFEPFGRRLLGIRKPQRDAIVVRDGEAKAFRRQGEPAHGRNHVERA